MKANKYLMKKDERAQVGIGTLIIFIAMVLVAAVAAAVLIQTSGVLQERASSTGQQAAQEVSSNMMVKSIEGVRSGDGTTENLSDTIDLVKVNVALNAGSSDIDLNQLVITVNDGVTANDLIYAGNDRYGTSMAGFDADANTSVNVVELLSNSTDGAGDNGKYFFVVEIMRDDDESFSQESPIMNQGDLVAIYISTVDDAATSNKVIGEFTATVDLDDTGLTIKPRSTFNINMIPESGSEVRAELPVPSFGVDTIISLR